LRDDDDDNDDDDDVDDDDILNNFFAGKNKGWVLVTKPMLLQLLPI
jgi:hypothetical protein